MERDCKHDKDEKLHASMHLFLDPICGVGLHWSLHESDFIALVHADFYVDWRHSVHRIWSNSVSPCRDIPRPHKTLLADTKNWGNYSNFMFYSFPLGGAYGQ